MCELLGMTANVPTDIVFSFTGLIQRGGRTGPHRDGWGMSFYEGKGICSFHDPAPGSDSEIARLVQTYPIKSEIVIGHIRQANVGKVSLVNTHPFIRELWGKYWCFAHNGQLTGLQQDAEFYCPVGDTDSETAFCHLLNCIRDKFPQPTAIEAVLPLVTECCEELRNKGVFNMLLSNGEWLLSYCTTKLAHITRCAPFGAAALKDADVTVDFKSQTTPNDVVTIIATEPLTGNENWVIHQPGQWMLWQGGEVLHSGGV